MHAEASSSAATDWEEIVALYDVLLRLSPLPVIELNRAAAVAFHAGPAVGLASIDALWARGELVNYHRAHAPRADLCRRLGLTAEARDAYQTRACFGSAETGAAIRGAAVARALAAPLARSSRLG
ncbi:MAG: hypothetical protein IT453_19640 [Planctomycetes bacterium]|nr:hypothetical protein [Planctomycetota bacterium]